ncbi:hypothetical protein DIZ27_13270 [Streptomyces sp. NWU339]|uniref:hypothetical protein n=1 Tax=Streptomyces sp. NWU339 TaxID=2185284 RepID=UPI000D680C02|nr:hypothetical protein [Streptomyces sp. NWU339]PWI10050.1 hypothetical protein DIZ27_13270 [Streptomyces sp. NWU339]
MRPRWAAAIVLLTSVLLAHLCSPVVADVADRRTAPDRHTVTHPTAAQDPAPQRVREPSPGTQDACLHRPLARSPRTAGATGAAHQAATDGRMNAVPSERGVLAPYPPGAPRGAEPAGPARDAAASQTLRC